jgi:uncharacterized phage protein gp47/JayE
MPWTTPSLDDVRKQNRDYITARLHSAPMVPNSVLRVLADGNAGLAYLVLLYIDWLSLQLLPDTAETEWLDRHAQIWIPPGRKAATFAGGSVTVTGINGAVIPVGSQLSCGDGGDVAYETINQVYVGATATPVNVRAIDAGAAGNLKPGDLLSFVTALAGIDGTATVVDMVGGADMETDDELRARVLRRIQQPPQGGDASDYEAWALAVPGVTRAWCAPLEMGIGTVTVRFMMDDLRADQGGFPTAADIELVAGYIDEKRPVAVKDIFVLAPIPQPIDFRITNLVGDDEATHEAIILSVGNMLYARAAPGQMIYRSWIDEAVSQAVGEDHHDLDFQNTAMESPGHLAVLGSIIYD